MRTYCNTKKPNIVGETPVRALEQCKNEKRGRFVRTTHTVSDRIHHVQITHITSSHDTLIPDTWYLIHMYFEVYYITTWYISITAVHSNQDHIWLAKIGDYIGFYVDRRSWLLWSPVIGGIRGIQAGNIIRRARAESLRRKKHTLLVYMCNRAFSETIPRSHQKLLLAIFAAFTLALSSSNNLPGFTFSKLQQTTRVSTKSCEHFVFLNTLSRKTQKVLT